MAKTILITGASGNMGQAMVKKFLAEGYHVTGTLVPADPVKIEIAAPAFETVEVDLLNEKASAEMVNAVIAKKGAIDVAVLTVGGFAMGSVEETSVSDINRQIQLNFITAYNVARPVFIQMKKQGSGRLFLVGSRPGMDMHNSKGMVAYGLSKSMIFRLAELMNEEASGMDVITQVIVPSTIDTPQNRKSMPDADFSKWVKADAIADVCFEAVGEIRDGRVIVI